MKNIAFLLFLFVGFTSFAQDSGSPLVSFEDYERLMSEVKEHRKARLVDLNTFQRMSMRQDVYILDTRSKEMYDRKHVKGAIHLNFSNFTQENLDALFPNRDAVILIYCNNNFMTEIQEGKILEDRNFASKVSRPIVEPIVTQTIQLSSSQEVQNQSEMNSITETGISEKPITLALNIPTYINLYGYGYKNVYELNELISVFDSRIEFEGTEVNTIDR
ncbi:MAG: rhodanese-like domain-containing protein [Flavobacteriales bacterium]|nr:rhodanese-like domain-containing protein [Flavobacteriales bacterium]